METTTSANSQTKKYFYWLVAMATFILIAAGISGAFVPEEGQKNYVESSEAKVKPAANRGSDLPATE